MLAVQRKLDVYVSRHQTKVELILWKYLIISRFEDMGKF